MPAFTCLRRSRHTNAAGDALASGGGSGSDWHDPLYDAAGNMTQGPAPGDETNTHKYIYDAWDRLVEVTDASDVTLASYEYDGLYRRIERREYASGSLSRTLHDYYSDAWQVLEVREDSETNAHEQYVWGVHYIDSPLCRDRDADDNGTSLEERIYYLTDANMNVTTLVNPSGTVLERYRYDAYGRAEVLEPNHAADGDGISDYDNSILYAGYRHDADTGLYHVRFRMYHPTLGRWCQRDPIGYVDGLNVYEYVRSQPRRRQDPQGLYCGECSPPIIGKNEYQSRITAAQFTPSDINPDRLAQSLWEIKAFNLVTKAADVAKLAAALAQGMTELAKEVVQQVPGQGQPGPNGPVEAMIAALQGRSFSIWVKVEFRSCESCWCIYRPFSKSYEWNDKHRWHKCIKGSQYNLGLYNAYAYPSLQDILDCMQEALQ